MANEWLITKSLSHTDEFTGHSRGINNNNALSSANLHNQICTHAHLNKAHRYAYGVLLDKSRPT